MTVENKLSFVRFQFENVNQNVQFADAKAGVIVVASGAFLTYVTGFLKYSEITIDMGVNGCPVLLDFEVTNYLWLFSVLLLFLSLAFSLYVLFPRMPKGGDSLVFWGSIAGMDDAGEYYNKVINSSDDLLLQQRTHQCYNIARVCSMKYKWLQLSMIAGFLGFVTGMASFVDMLG